MTSEHLKYWILSIFACSLLASCGHDGLTKADSIAETEAQSLFLTPGNLKARKIELDGAAVRVRAYLVFEAGSQSLWTSSRSESDADVSQCVSLLYPEHLEHKLRSANRRTILLSGVFRRDVTEPNTVYLGLCSYAGVVVESFEVERSH